jgi:uncharacterized protein
MISSAAFMSYQSAQRPIFDGFDFVSAGGKQRGTMPFGEFPRLHDLLASPDGTVAYEMQGLRDARGRACLRLRVHGTMQLRCQRCLEAMHFEVSEDALLVLAATQEEIDADPTDASAPDRVLAGKEMVLRDLVEDELILALPFAPRHAACEPGAPGVRKDGKVSPFSGLHSLLRDKR